MLARLPRFVYLGLVLGGYHLFSRDMLAYLPQPHAPSWHTWTAGLAVTVVLISFTAATWSDPGFITLFNYKLHHASEGGSLKSCRTCGWIRPHGSKHCSLCNRCVARIDHHCYLQNIHFFLLFLAANALLCLYGTALAITIVLGVMDKALGLNSKRIDYRTGKVYSIRDKPLGCLAWACTRLSIQVTIAVFLFSCFLTALVFFALHSYRTLRSLRLFANTKKKSI